MKQFLIFLVKKIIPYLKEKGVDVRKFIPEDEKTIFEVKLKLLTDDFKSLQSEISLKRAYIIEAQKNLIQTAEPMLFSSLGSEDVDFWKKSTFTKVWLDNIMAINDLVDEHEDLMNQFQITFHQIEDVKKHHIHNPHHKGNGDEANAI